jgi:phosphatidylglycerophosphatase A
MADGIRDSGFGIRPDSTEQIPAEVKPDGTRDSALGNRVPDDQIPNPKSHIPFAVLVASVFGVGYAPFAPGTFGSAAGLVVWWLVPASAVAQGLAIVAIFAIGSWSGGIAERHFGRTDPGHVVIDEVMGMLITLFLNPVGWWGALGGFLLFRLFDVIKPWPSNRLEQLHGGIGVMADDGMAAIYANLALRAGIWFSRHLVQ